MASTRQQASSEPFRQPAHLTPQQRASLEEQGYLIIPGALTPRECAHFIAIVEDLDRTYRSAAQARPEDFLEIRNAISKDSRLLELLTWPTTFPLVAELMGPNIQVNTTHTMVRPPQPAATDASYKRIDWHCDGAKDIQAVHGTFPWLYTKIGYFLTDLSQPGMGAMRVVPGSHKKAQKPQMPPGAADPAGTIELQTRPGDALIFVQPLWHAVGPNTSTTTRKNIYFGYCRRWVKPLDYLTPDPELLERATPIERQLLGEYRSEMTFWLPKPDELPLATWLEQHQTARPDQK